jgi:hypothetical protein
MQMKILALSTVAFAMSGAGASLNMAHAFTDWRAVAAFDGSAVERDHCKSKGSL